MARYGNFTIENLTPLEAEKRGYLLPCDARVSQEWIEAKIETRHSNTIVYVNGIYRGVAKRTTVLYKIMDKFGL